jgi:DNA modification methylase
VREVTIGECRLILGDCREVLPGLPTVDAVIVDPPYS